MIYFSALGVLFVPVTTLQSCQYEITKYVYIGKILRGKRGIVLTRGNLPQTLFSKMTNHTLTIIVESKSFRGF